MENNEYLTVTAFAKAVGTSNQAIYQQLNKRLKPYYKVIDNKKMINIKAIEDIYQKSVDTTNQQVFQEEKQELINELKEHIKDLQEQLAVARADKEVKDKQIANLNERLAEANALNQNNQILIGRQQEPTALPEQTETTPAKQGFKFKLSKLFGKGRQADE
jgi:uncharacterized protein YaaW (UPF0174 family)